MSDTPGYPTNTTDRDIHIAVNQQVGTVDGGAVTGVKIGSLTGDVVHGNKTTIQHIVQQAAARLSGSPYKFLSSYDLADRDIFYGRDMVIEEIAARVARHKVVIVNGASGSGKTSLVNAGILPRLAEHGYTFIDFREYSDPLAQVRSYLAGRDLIQVSEEASLVQVFQAFQARQETKLVVVFDQFERFLVNVPPARRNAFIDELKRCIATFSAEEMHFVFVLRQDFLGQMLSEIEDIIPAFATEAYRYNLKALSRAEAREAIIQPLQQIEAKIDYDDAFVDGVLLAGLAAQEGEQRGINPPHLQIVCHQLFEAAHQRYQDTGRFVVIDQALYEELGGAASILNSYLDRAVEEIAEDPAKVAVVRSMLKAMIETTGTRRFVSLADLGAALPDVDEREIAELLDRLAERRVIEVRKPEYSLSHEYMVEQVRRWFDERELERKKARETLDRGLKAWQASEALLNVRQVGHIRTWLVALTEAEAGLLARSQAKYERDRRLKRFGLGAIVGLAVVATIAALLALWKWGEAEDQTVLAREEALKAEETAEFVVNMFEEADPQNALGDTLTVFDLVELGAERVERELAGQPTVQAQMQDVIGRLYRVLGDYDKALVPLQRSLVIRDSLYKQDHEDRAESLNDLADLFNDRGDYDKAEQLYSKALAMRQHLLGEEHSDVAETLNNLAMLHWVQGEYAAAEPLLRRALAMRKKLLGREHEDVAEGLDNLALLLEDMNNPDAADSLYREALSIRREVLSETHPDVAYSLNNLGAFLYGQGDYDAAEPLWREALAIRQKVLGETHPDVALSMHNLAAVLNRQGDYAAAEPIARKVLALWREQLGEDHPRVAMSLTSLAKLLFDKGDYAASESTYREALVLHRTLRPEGDAWGAATLVGLGEALMKLQRPGEAEPLLREGLAFRLKRPELRQKAGEAQSVLGACLAAQGRYNEAEPLLLKGFEVLKQAQSDQHKETQKAIQRLVTFYEASGKPDAAASYQVLLVE